MGVEELTREVVLWLLELGVRDFDDMKASWIGADGKVHESKVTVRLKHGT